MDAGQHELDLNLPDPVSGDVPLFIAISGGYSKVVGLLLCRADVDVNVRNEFDQTPLEAACWGADAGVVLELLRDSRVRARVSGDNLRQPLYICCTRWGHIPSPHHLAAVQRTSLANIKHLLALRTAEVLELAHHFHEGANLYHCWPMSREAKDLLRAFCRDSPAVVHTLLVELGSAPESAAGRFAVTVFLSDGLLRIQPLRSADKRCRFLRLAARLPLELQMILCHRSVSVSADIILKKHSEPAFRALARVFSKWVKKTL